MLPHTSLWNKRLLWTFSSPTSSLPHCLLSAFLLCKRFISSFHVPVHLCLGYQPILPSQGFCYFLVYIFITLSLAEIILKLKVKCIEICNWSWIIWVFWIIWHSQMLGTPYHYYFLLLYTPLPTLHQKQVSKTSHCFGFNFLPFVGTGLVFYVPTYFLNFSAFWNYKESSYLQWKILSDLWVWESDISPYHQRKVFFKNFYEHFQI